MLPILRFDRFL